MKNYNLHFLLLISLLFIQSCSENITDPKIIPYNWITATPESEGIDIAILEKAAESALSEGFIHSFAIVRNDKLIYEKYFYDRNMESIHIVRSVSKSYLSALYGIAIENGYIKSLDQKLVEFFPEYIQNDKDSRKKDITIRHLLQMKSGFGGDQSNYNYFFTSKNWIETICKSKLDFSPGTKFQYTTGGTHLLSAILTKATGMNLKDFADKFLFSKIGVTLGDWEKDPQGYYFGGNNMYFTTRDMARFGQLFLHKGNLNGEQVVPESWATQSVSSLYKSSGSNWGKLFQIGYGYLWWTGKINNYPVYMALGHGGQYIINIPTLNMIIVFTSNGFVDWDSADQNERNILQIVSDHILSAVIE